MPTTEQSILNKLEWAKSNKGLTEDFRRQRIAALEAQLKVIREPQDESEAPADPFQGDYEQALAEVLRRVSCGECLSVICKTPGLPEAEKIRAAVIENKPQGFRAKFAYARDLGCDAIAEEVLIATSKPARQGFDLRAFVEARRWYLSKMAPIKYGEKAQPEIGPQTTMPAKIVIEVVQTPKMIEPSKVTNAIP